MVKKEMSGENKQETARLSTDSIIPAPFGGRAAECIGRNGEHGGGFRGGTP